MIKHSFNFKPAFLLIKKYPLGIDELFLNMYFQWLCGNINSKLYDCTFKMNLYLSHMAVFT